MNRLQKEGPATTGNLEVDIPNSIRSSGLIYADNVSFRTHLEKLAKLDKLSSAFQHSNVTLLFAN